MRRLFGVAVFAAVIGLIVTLSFGYADHAPKPHGVRIAVAAPPAVQQRLAASLTARQTGAFRLVPASDGAAAERLVRDQSVLGGFVVSPSGPNLVVTAGAQGTLAQTVITKVFTAASAEFHSPVTSLDVAQLGPGDASGLGSFVFELGLLIPSVIGSVGLFLLGNRLRLWWRVLASLVFALLAALGGTLAMDTIFGALPGAGGELILIGFLGAGAFVLFVAAVQSFVGLPGTGLAALAFIFVGNAVSGGSVPVAFLPGGFRQVAPWLPNNGIIRGVRDVVYYNGHDLGHSLLVLGAWSVAALLILGLVDGLHLRARARWPHLAAEVYSTPGIVHLRGAFAGGDGAGAEGAVVAPDAVDAPEVPDAAGVESETGAEPGPELVLEPTVDAGSVVALLPAAPEIADAVATLRPASNFSTPPVPLRPPVVEPKPEVASQIEPDVEPDPDITADIAPGLEVEPEPEVAAGSGVSAEPGGESDDAEPVHHLPEVPANSGIPRVPDLHRETVVQHAEVRANLVTVQAETVIISAGSIDASLLEGGHLRVNRPDQPDQG